MLGTGVPLPAAFVTHVLGFSRPDEIKFSGQLLRALAKISPELVPSTVRHPFADAILEGRAAIPSLVAALEAARDEDTQAALIDALGELAAREYATRPLVEAVARALNATRSEKVTSVACRVLAVARDPAFVEQQRALLGSNSPSAQRVAARLLGYAKDEVSVPKLLELLHADALALADAVIWALGEIGAAEATPKLHRLIHAHIQVTACVEALGKLGEGTSLVRLLPLLVEGADAQREKAAWAIARILRAQDGQGFEPELQQNLDLALERAVDQDPSRVVRFHAIVALSLLGHGLEPKRILAALGGQLGPEDLDAMGNFFASRPTRGKHDKPKK